MSFVDRDGVMSLIEHLLAYSWPEELGSIKIPFKLMAYDDVMELYGTDQPDLRIPYRVRIYIMLFYFSLYFSVFELNNISSFPQIQNLTHIIDLPVLKETVKLEYDKPKVYALVFPNKSVSFCIIFY